MTVYLVDEVHLDVAMAHASMDKEAHIVLLQDAVYAALTGKVHGAAFALDVDVARRGLGGKMPRSIRVIGSSDLVQMMEKEKVVNFL